MTRRLRRAFTLIECIIAVFVLAVGFVAVASLYPLAYRGATLNANRIAALQVASGLLARIRANPYGMQPASTWLLPETLPTLIEGNPSSVTFTKAYKFTRGGTSATPNANADVVQITITWDEGTGAASERQTKTIVVTGGICREP